MRSTPITATEIMESYAKHAEYCAKVDKEIRLSVQPWIDLMVRNALERLHVLYPEANKGNEK